MPFILHFFAASSLKLQTYLKLQTFNVSVIAHRQQLNQYLPNSKVIIICSVTVFFSVTQIFIYHSIISTYCIKKSQYFIRCTSKSFTVGEMSRLREKIVALLIWFVQVHILLYGILLWDQRGTQTTKAFQKLILNSNRTGAAQKITYRHEALL